MSGSILIGIAGGTGSGKSTLSKKIQERFHDEVLIMCQDSYYRQRDDLTHEERAKVNYDHPDAIDTGLLINDLKTLKRGLPINMPKYSFVEHNRLKECVRIAPKKVIILEGILIFENKELRDMMDMKIYVDTDADVRFIRRLMRDVKERGRSLDSVVNQYINTVKPMHEEFVEPSKRYADIIVPEGGHNRVALGMLIDKINAILSKK